MPSSRAPPDASVVSGRAQPPLVCASLKHKFIETKPTISRSESQTLADISQIYVEAAGVAVHDASAARAEIVSDMDFGASRMTVMQVPLLNRGPAFSLEERTRFHLHGLLPASVPTLEQQVLLVRRQLAHLQAPMLKYLELDRLRRTNTVLFFSVVMSDLNEFLPIVYTPTVGEACLRFSSEFRGPSGLWLNPSMRGHVRSVLQHWPGRDVHICVATDGSRILGLGDLGANGMAIAIGKLSLYVAGAGFHPGAVLPLMIDLGTDNDGLLTDPHYLGWRQQRLRGEAYASFMDEVLKAFHEEWPYAVFQFEDFATPSAFSLLERHRKAHRLFNDDVQGTGAVISAGFYNAARVSGIPMHEQRLLFFGAGSAAVGVADSICAMIHESLREMKQQANGASAHTAESAADAEGLAERAREHIWLVDSRGLVTTTRGDRLAAHKTRYARTDAVQELKTLEDIVRKIRPTALLGLSGQPQYFTPGVLRLMAEMTSRPIIMALSNPTSRSETTAQQAYMHTDGACIFASGSPFPPVVLKGKQYVPAQGNNFYVFPGIGLGAYIASATRITDAMLHAAAYALAKTVDDDGIAQGRLYPPISDIRDVSVLVAIAVIRQAAKENLTPFEIPDDIGTFIRNWMWSPSYRELPSPACIGSTLARLAPQSDKDKDE